MKKRYLKTAEDVLALKDTDTKIYVEDECGYYKFVNGVFCAFDDEDNSWSICSTLYGPSKIYILEEEKEQEATEADINKLCKFWDEESEPSKDRILVSIRKDCEYRYVDTQSYSWKHCRRLAPSEVEELTGYKVEKVK